MQYWNVLCSNVCFSYAVPSLVCGGNKYKAINWKRATKIEKEDNFFFIYANASIYQGWQFLIIRIGIPENKPHFRKIIKHAHNLNFPKFLKYWIGKATAIDMISEKRLYFQCAHFSRKSTTLDVYWKSWGFFWIDANDSHSI